jgi:hypothetical protein
MTFGRRYGAAYKFTTGPPTSDRHAMLKSVRVDRLASPLAAQPHDQIDFLIRTLIAFAVAKVAHTSIKLAPLFCGYVVTDPAQQHS